ncbi:CDP-2,3-bis-(O-geranylgeranyl)-sn-glycerol synthase [Candidatus Peregrinibacteria bacterium]|nr:CDP-2,3-bis-(O-geranylgeranyl)-sn-glycerol synthase [Candidatus Peregrinibacteria bacterium]
MFELILSSIYLILPAYVANACPIIAAKLKLPFRKPIHKKIFGSHKSWRGFYAGYIGALIILFIQFLLQKHEIFTGYNLLNYEQINLFLYAFLFGIGAITGDLIKSFFKRRFNIKPGKSWFPFDQLDFIIGSLIFLLPFYIPSWQVIVTLVILTPLIHFLANILGYLLHLKKVWW